MKFLKDFEKNLENISKAKFSVLKGGKSLIICFQFFNLNQPQ